MGKRIPELYQGDARDEAAVLDWVLVQAGLETAGDEDGGLVEEVMEEIDEMLTFPGASAETEPPPPPQPRLTPPETKKENKSQSFNPSEEATPEPLSEIVDIIKNDNNVVVFFLPKDEQVLNFGSDPFEEESEVSCWPLVCASAKKSSHKGLNIDKLTTRPVIRTGEKKEESVGWLSWLLGIDLSYYTEEVPEEEEDEESANSVDSD